MREILDDKEQYATINDGMIMAHEMGHMIYKPQHESIYFGETNAILMETLFQNFVRENYPQFAREMDYYNYFRNGNSLEKMIGTKIAVRLALLKKKKGKDITNDDLIDIYSLGELNIAFDESDNNGLCYEARDLDYVKKKRALEVQRLVTLLKDNFPVPIEKSEYKRPPKILKSESEYDETIIEAVNKLQFNGSMSYPLRNYIGSNIIKEIL